MERFKKFFQNFFHKNEKKFFPKIFSKNFFQKCFPKVFSKNFWQKKYFPKEIFWQKKTFSKKKIYKKIWKKEEIFLEKQFLRRKILILFLSRSFWKWNFLFGNMFLFKNFACKRFFPRLFFLKRSFDQDNF